MTGRPDLPAILGAVRVVSPSSVSLVHGEDHWRRVAANGLDLAAEVGADPLLVVLFAIFHDSMRFSEGSDDGHGRLGGRLARGHNGELIGLSDARLELLDTACANHTLGLISDEPTIGVCWDADRLDLCRLGRPINPAAISTAAGRTEAVQQRAAALLRATPDWAAIFARLPLRPSS